MHGNILITGASGFVGAYLIRQLLKTGNKEIVGTYLDDSSLEKLEEFKGQVNFEKIDLLNKDNVFDLINKIKPEKIYHLAAFTNPTLSFKSPAEFIMNNISSEINILEALKEYNFKKTKVLIVSSGDVYGKVKKENLPINEKTPLNPANPYAVSKLTQDFLGLQYFLSYNLNVVRVRPFNHIGPGQGPGFVVPAFCKKIAEIEKNKREPILPVGNLESKRDFTDVRDMIRAYELILEKGEAGDVYNIGSGKSHKIGDILKILLSFSKKDIEVKVDKSLLRPVDEPELVCDCSKLKKVIDWEPLTPIKQTLRETLDYWRNII